MVAKKEKIVLLVALVLVSCIAKADLAIPGAVPILEQHQTCSSDNECILIQRHCGDCDCGTPVNLRYEKIYLEEKKNRCANYKGGVCDLTCPTNDSVCREGKCTTK